MDWRQKKQDGVRKDQIGNLIGTPATLYILFLPLHYNDGRRIQPARLSLAQREILRYAGGLTRFSPCVGFWIDRTARAYRDLVLPVQTVVSTSPEADTWFAHLAAKMALLLEQQQIFLFAQPVMLIEATSLEFPVLVRPRG